MTSEMMPCRCGGKSWMQRREDAPLCRITCNRCPASTAWLSDAEAIAAWNTRPAPAGELAALAEAMLAAQETAYTATSASTRDDAWGAFDTARAAFHAALAAHLAEVRAAIEPLRALHVAQVAAWPASEQWDDRCSIMVDWPVVCRLAALAKKLEG